MRCADENQLVMLVRVEGSKSEAAEKCRQGKCILLTSLFIDELLVAPGLFYLSFRAGFRIAVHTSDEPTVNERVHTLYGLFKSVASQMHE